MTSNNPTETLDKDSIVEKVARAICESKGLFADSVDRRLGIRWKNYLPEAKAAIAAHLAALADGLDSRAKEAAKMEFRRNFYIQVTTPTKDWEFNSAIHEAIRAYLKTISCTSTER